MGEYNKDSESKGTFRIQKEKIKARRVPSAIIFDELKAIYEQKILEARAQLDGPLTEEQYKSIAITTEDINIARKTGKMSIILQQFAQKFGGVEHACKLAEVPFLDRRKNKK